MTHMQESHDTNKNVNKKAKKMIYCLKKERYSATDLPFMFNHTAPIIFTLQARTRPF